MSKSVYDSGVKGCAESNIGNVYSNLPNAIFGGVSDDDGGGNFDRVGHRRWVLNPTMKNTGFGLIDDFCAMYSFDCNCPENKEKILLGLVKICLLNSLMIIFLGLYQLIKFLKKKLK